MPRELQDGTALPPPAAAPRPHLRMVADELDLAYLRARHTGYRTGSREMQALYEAEDRYQRAKDC